MIYVCVQWHAIPWANSINQSERDHDPVKWSIMHRVMAMQNYARHSAGLHYVKKVTCYNVQIHKQQHRYVQ